MSILHASMTIDHNRESELTSAQALLKLPSLIDSRFFSLTMSPPNEAGSVGWFPDNLYRALPLAYRVDKHLQLSLAPRTLSEHRVLGWFSETCYPAGESNHRTLFLDLKSGPVKTVWELSYVWHLASAVGWASQEFAATVAAAEHGFHRKRVELNRVNGTPSHRPWSSLPLFNGSISFTDISACLSLAGRFSSVMPLMKSIAKDTCKIMLDVISMTHLPHGAERYTSGGQLVENYFNSGQLTFIEDILVMAWHLEPRIFKTMLCKVIFWSPKFTSSRVEERMRLMGQCHPEVTWSQLVDEAVNRTPAQPHLLDVPGALGYSNHSTSSPEDVASSATSPEQFQFLQDVMEVSPIGPTSATDSNHLQARRLAIRFLNEQWPVKEPKPRQLPLPPPHLGTPEASLKCDVWWNARRDPQPEMAIFPPKDMFLTVNPLYVTDRPSAICKPPRYSPYNTRRVK
jgi:hypothetical protein